MAIIYCKCPFSFVPIEDMLHFSHANIDFDIFFFSCWLSVYESVVWWLVGPIAGMSVVNLMILFVSVKAAFTLKDHVLGFGNLR